MSRITFLKQWKHKGVNCAIARSPFGSVNGYVQDSRFGTADYDDIELDVHGGLTFGPDEDGWIGFDTMHCGDVWPLEYLEEHYPYTAGRKVFSDMCSVERKFPSKHQTHWTEEKVIEEVNRVAEQMRGLSPVVTGKVIWRQRKDV